MALSEADHLTEPTACSSSLKMQEPTCNFPPEKDEERPEAESLSRVELEQAQHEPEDSISTCDPWPLPAEDSLCFPPCLEEQPQDTEAAPRPLWGSLSNKHHENQGNLLQFDRQALGRISTSPTLRRLRGRGWRTWPSPPQEDALETHTDGSCGGPTDNLPKSLPGNPKDSPKLTSPLTPGTSLPSSMQKAFNSAHSLEPPAKPSDECALPMLQIIHEGPLPQASLLTSRNPDPQGTQVEKKHRSRRPQPQRDLPDPAKLSRSSVLPPESASLESVLFPASNPAAGTLPDTYGSSVIKKGESEVDWFYEHRRSSVVLNLPGLEVFPGDLLVSDGAADYLCHPLLLLNSESKKPRWPFSKRGVGKDRHKHILDLERCLSSMKTADSRDYEFCGLKDKTWNEVMETHQNLPNDQSDLRKQQEAVWELFTSECTYFLDHLLVLKMVFMNTLKYLQIHEYLLDVNLWRLFANLEELTQTSLGFANSLFGVFKDYMDASETTPPMDFASVLTKCFCGRLCPSHQTYCLNYSAAVFYLERLRHRDDFSIYLKWCEQNEHCRRLHLTELLVAPLHRLTRYPLLLKNIWKRSTDPTEKIMIYSIKEKVEKSIRDLEGKVKWLDNYQKFKHLQDIIVWPPLWERDKRFFIPECLKHIFKEHMAETILSPTSRHLIYEGKLTLAESTRFLDVYLFLFDDFLLVTKPKRNKKKLGGLDTGLVCPSLTPELQTVVKEGVSCTVLDQPIPLDRMVVKSIDPLHMSVFGLRNAFLIQHENRYHQCVAAFLLQAQTENIKKMWMAQITAAISCFTKSQETTKVSLFTLPSESSEI